AAIRPAVGSAIWALGVLDLGLGRPERALERLSRLAGGQPRFGMVAHATGDLVEAAVRAGRTEVGTAVLDGDQAALTRLAGLTGRPWALALTGRPRITSERPCTGTRPRRVPSSGPGPSCSTESGCGVPAGRGTRASTC